MPRPPEFQRLCVAVLCSLLLHVAWLLAGWQTSAPASGTYARTPFDLVLTTQLPPSAGRPHRGAPPASPAVDPPTEAIDAAAADPNRHLGAAELTRRPRPLGAVNLAIPEAGLLTTPGKMVLTLWIDDQGNVTAFEVDAPDLPEEYTTAVLEIFTVMRFAPGEVRGRKVRSILKLEVGP